MCVISVMTVRKVLHQITYVCTCSVQSDCRFYWVAYVQLASRNNLTVIGKQWLITTQQTIGHIGKCFSTTTIITHIGQSSRPTHTHTMTVACPETYTTFEGIKSQTVVGNKRYTYAFGDRTFCRKPFALDCCAFDG